MRSARLAACVSVLLAFGACGSSSKSSQNGAPDGGRDVAALGGSGGSTVVAGSTGAVGGTSAGGGTTLGGALSSTASGGRGGSAGATTAGGGTSGSDAGVGGTGGNVQLDGGASSRPDGSTQIDAPADSTADRTDRAEVSTDDGGAVSLAFCRTTSTGCQCVSVATGEPAISTCSKQSLGVANEVRCCQTSAYCSCDSLGCVAETSGGRCRCDFASLLSLLPPTYSKVAQCPAPTSGMKCCLHSVEGYCECKQQTCPAGSAEVTTCTVPLLSACASGEQAVEVCK